MRKNYSEPVWGSSLNTLAQNGTDYLLKPAQIITGKGSELNNPKGRAKRKMITQALVLAHIDIANKNEDFERAKSSWNTYHCQGRIYGFESRYYGKYCKNRFCTLCCSIRKAAIINRYIPTIKLWAEPYFVTLTVKSIPKNRLALVMKKMIQGFHRISEKHRKRAQRGKGTILMGVKSLECNFNPIKRTYNPHFHIITANKETAEIIVNEWLNLWGKKWAQPQCQNITKVMDLEKALIEIIKYGSKIFTEPDLAEKSKCQVSGKIRAAALYNIFEAMRSLRIFDRFGFNLPKQGKEYYPAKVVRDYQEWVYLPEFHDWQNSENELVLSAYNPDNELKNLLEYGIEKEAE